MNSQSFNYFDGGQEWLIEKCLNCLNHPKVENTGGKNITSKPLAEQNNSSSTNSQKEDDSINLIDDFSTSLHINKNNIDSFTDRHMKELLNFVKTSGNCCNNKNAFTQEEERQYKEFFDKLEGKIQSTQGSVSSLYRINEDFIGTPKVLIPKMNEINIEDDQKINEDLIDEILLDKNIEKQRFRSATNVHQFEENSIPTNKINPPNLYPNENSSTDATDTMDEIIRSNTINFSIKTPKHNYKTDCINNNNIYPTKDDTNQKSNTTTDDLVTKHDIKYLESMVMDEKLKKFCVFKTETEKLYLTPGPTLHEKSVILPQIMKRLTDRKRELEDQNNIKQKLVLDAGSSNQDFENDNIPNYQKSSIQAAHVNGFKNDENIDTRKQMVEPNKCCSSPKTSQTPTTNGKRQENIRFVPVEELRALYKDKPDYIKIGPHVLKPPEPLLKDCNKKRFVAYATSQLLNDLIQK